MLIIHFLIISAMLGIHISKRYIELKRESEDNELQEFEIKKKLSFKEFIKKKA